MLTDRTTIAATVKILLEVISEEPPRVDTPRLAQALRARGVGRTPRSVQSQLQEAMHPYLFVCVDRTKARWCAPAVRPLARGVEP